jgi:UDP-GlcNAc3NAcA epimerase
VKPLKVITVVGARPQFIKAAAVSRAIGAEYGGAIEERIVHTGQHFDDNMSQVFFDDLEIPRPHYHLAISGGAHGAMTGRMLEAIEGVLLTERPDWVLIYGDTNSTLAGALSAAKLHIRVAHVEAGLRSFNMRMPEEVNRVISDRLSTLLFCPTQTAVGNLNAEGITRGIHNVGDVMFDVALYYRERACKQSNVLQSLHLQPKRFALATCHRAENTDDPARLAEILAGLAQIAQDMPVVLPLHPRTRKLVQTYGLQDYLSAITVCEPLPFFDMVALEQAAKVILTDSGGVQKEAFFYGVPCITLRDETEWVETVQLGWNQLVGASQQAIVQACAQVGANLPDVVRTTPYGVGHAARDILAHLL